MMPFITKCVNIFLLSISVFNYNVDAFNYTDLALICAPRFGIEITPTPPPQCTALALSTFDAVRLAELRSVKGTLPLMIVEDRYNLYKLAYLFTNPVAEYITTVKELGVDVVVFDLINYVDYSNFSEPEFSSNIAKFFDVAKHDFPEMLFGIAFALHEDPIRISVDVKVINEHVDFYLLKFVVYRECVHEKNPREMVYSASTDDILSTITLFRNCGMDTSKLIYTIDLRIFTHKKRAIIPDSNDMMAYSELCSKEVSENRKFCYNTVPDLFDKAQICIKEQLLGIYINNTDYDDFDGSCKCAGPDGEPIKFKGISVIAGACCDDKANVSSFNCESFPTIKNP